MKHEADTKYFDNYEEEEPWWLPENDVKRKVKLNEDNYEDFLFYDFTLKKDIEKEKAEFVENYFKRLQQMAINKKNAYMKKKKPLLIDSDSLVSFTEERQTNIFSKKEVNDILSKPVRTKISSCSKRSKINTEVSDKSITMGKSNLTKPSSSKIFTKVKLEARGGSKMSKPKEQPFINGISTKFFNTCALQERKLKAKLSPKSGKNTVTTKNTSKETDKPYFNFKFHKPDTSIENLSQKLNSAKSTKFFAKLKTDEASIKNKFVINIKNYQSPQKQPNFLLDFMNTNIYGKTKLNLSSSPQRTDIQNPLLQPSFYKLSVPHSQKVNSSGTKESIDTKIFKAK